MTDPADAQRSMVFDRLHPPVDALPNVSMPEGRIVGFTVGPDQKAWEVIVHEAEQRYTLRSPPDFDGADDSKGTMIFTDFDTVAKLTADHGAPLPRDVQKGIKKGKIVKGWEPGTYLTTKIKHEGMTDGLLTALRLEVLVKHLAYEYTGESAPVAKPTLLKRITRAFRRK